MTRFVLEDWFAEHKSDCHINLGSSDIEPLGVADLLSLAGENASEQWRQLSLAYGPSRGSEQLRERIASLYESIHPDQVHVFNGATEAYFALINVLIRPAAKVVVFGPTYQLLTGIPAAAGATVQGIDLNLVDRHWRLDPHAVSNEVVGGASAVVLNWPNNPTGFLPTPGDLESLYDDAARHGAWLINDETYRGVEPEGVRLPAAADLGERGISIGSLSKTFGLAGLRIGWVVCRDAAVLDALRTYRYWTSLSGNVAGDFLATTALDVRDALHDRALQLISVGRSQLTRFVETHAQLAYFDSGAQAGTTVMLELLEHNAHDVALQLITNHGVFAVPGQVLGVSGQHLRIPLGRAGLADGLHALSVTLTGLV